jgi:hypothetical protein
VSTSALPPFQPKVASGSKVDPEKRKSDIRELYQASKKYIQENYWEELTGAYRAVKVRTNPAMIKDEKGNQVEDTNRTNVCMPGLNTIVKRKTARKTANPPTLNYYVPGDDTSLLAERLTARAYYEYDRSGEAWEFRRFVNQADIFGFSYMKTFYDTLDVVKQMRYKVASLSDRQTFMQAQGLSQDEIQSAIQTKGPNTTPEELSQYIQQNGPEIRGTQPLTLYEGPVSQAVFIGDLFLEPGCLTLNRSSYAIETFTETDLWIRKMAMKTYTDPETGKEVPVMDRAALDDLWSSPSSSGASNDPNRLDDIRKELRASIQKADPMIERRLLPGKRFDIMTNHAPDDNGQMWIEYIGNERFYLGRQPYPFDLCGKFIFTEYVPWPDVISCIGDSSPRILRFLHSMHNANAGQIIDVVNQVLRRKYKVSTSSDIPLETIKTDFGDCIPMPNGNMNAVVPLIEPGPVPDAWQTNAFIKTEMRENEPSLGGVDAGTEFNPQADKTATTAILAAKSSDVLMQAEIDALNLSLKELGEKKLEIHRQLSDKPITVPNRPQYVKTQALTEKYGKVAMISIDPMEIQNPEIQVEPVAGSTLAVDDELRANKIERVYQMAEADPILWNKYEAGKLVLTTIKGVGDTSNLLNDPAAAQPAGPKVGVNISIPLDKMPPDVQQIVFQEALGMQSHDLVAKSSLDAVQHASAAADAAANLASPAHPPKNELQVQQNSVAKKVNGAPGA